MFADPAQPTGPIFNFRRCLWLCLPALILGAVLRISFLVAIPPTFYGSDSNSYFDTASKFWIQGVFKNSAKRRYLYPLFLTGVAGLPGKPAITAAVIQHAVGLGTLLGIGWITGQVTRRPKIWVPAVTLVAAIWPRMLWFEHEMIAEVFVLASLVLTVSLALPLERLRTAKGLLLFLLSAGLIIGFKPHGRPLWLVLIALCACYSWPYLRWKWQHWSALAASIFILVTGGSESQGSWLLLSSTLPLVKTEGSRWAEYRAVLKPHIEEARADLPNYASKQGRYKKLIGIQDKDGPLGPVWNQLGSDRKKYATVAKSLSLQAILSAPWSFSHLVIQKLLLVLSDEDAGEKIPPEAFWKKQIDSSEERWESHPKEMQLVYGTDFAGYEELKQTSRNSSLWFASWVEPAAKQLAWVTYLPGKEGNPPSITLRWPAYLLLLGLLTSLVPTRFRSTCIVWLPAVLYCGAIFSVGDAVRRYLHPVDWCFLILVALGLDAVCDLAGRWKKKPTDIAPL